MNIRSIELYSEEKASTMPGKQLNNSLLDNELIGRREKAQKSNKAPNILSKQ